MRELKYSFLHQSSSFFFFQTEWVGLEKKWWFTQKSNVSFSFKCLQDDGIMDHDTDGDGAINLSTSQRPSASTTPNGDAAAIYGQDQQENEQVRITLEIFPDFLRLGFIVKTGKPKIWQIY